ncbi:MAG: heme-binding protein [Gammaproteobacteria bacterium]|jgi:glc operon protein GlcG
MVLARKLARFGFTLTTVALALAVHVGTARAQVAAKKTLTLDGARTVAAAVATEARKHAVGGAIAVVDDGGNVLYVERLDGTFPAAAEVAVAKARTAAIFRRPTRVFEDAIRGGRTSLVAVSVMTPLEGGQPIIVDDQVVGAVGVSGAASSQQDEEFALIAAAALSSGGTATSSR